jgi:hypothetical protein
VIPRPEGGDIIIWVQAVGLGFEEKAEQVFPTPVAPTRFARDSRGRLMKDPETHRVVTEPDETPAYKEAVSTCQRRQMMLLLERAIDDPDWSFEATHPGDLADKAAIAEYYDKLFEEFQKAGFTLGDLTIIVQKVMTISNMSKEALENARDALVEGKP